MPGVPGEPPRAPRSVGSLGMPPGFSSASWFLGGAGVKDGALPCQSTAMHGSCPQSQGLCTALRKEPCQAHGKSAGGPRHSPQQEGFSKPFPPEYEKEAITAFISRLISPSPLHGAIALAKAAHAGRAYCLRENPPRGEKLRDGEVSTAALPGCRRTRVPPCSGTCGKGEEERDAKPPPATQRRRRLHPHRTQPHHQIPPGRCQGALTTQSPAYGPVTAREL